jgi:hypothetical protein
MRHQENKAVIDNFIKSFGDMTNLMKSTLEKAPQSMTPEQAELFQKELGNIDIKKATENLNKTMGDFKNIFDKI